MLINLIYHTKSESKYILNEYKSPCSSFNDFLCLLDFPIPSWGRPLFNPETLKIDQIIIHKMQHQQTKKIDTKKHMYLSIDR